MEMKTKVEGTLDVAKNTLDQVQMWLPRGMHVETSLLNSMSNIWTCQCKIL
jgi:hypothetical protein